MTFVTEVNGHDTNGRKRASGAAAATQQLVQQQHSMHSLDRVRASRWHCAAGDALFAYCTASLKAHFCKGPIPSRVVSGSVRLRPFGARRVN